MIALQLIALWLFVPAALFAVATMRIRRLRREREHDLILYALCHARDTVAVKAVRGEIDERSQIFWYFYKQLSEIIHEHKRHPIGFAHLAKNLADNRNRPTPTWVLRLMRELKKSDMETKLMARRYIDAIQLIMKQDSLVVLFDKLPSWIRKHGGFFRALADQPLLPKRQRSFARFNLALANTVGYYTDDLCAAPA